MGRLADELLLAVLSHLPVSDLGAVVPLVCKQLHWLSNDASLWRHRYAGQFGAWVPAVHCQQLSEGLGSWKLKYRLEHALTQGSGRDLFAFGFMDCQPDQGTRRSTSYVHYSPTVDALVLVHNVGVRVLHLNIGPAILPTCPKRGRTLVWRARCGDRVGYALDQHPTDPGMVHKTLWSLVQSSPSLDFLHEWEIIWNLPLRQMRLAALGKTGELAFQPQTFSIHQPWSFLGHLLKDGAPALRSLDIYNPGFVTKDASRPHDSIATVLHLIATRNSGLERISLGLTDLIDDIVPIIKNHPRLRVLSVRLNTTSLQVPAKVVWLRLVEALSHSSSLETLKLIFSGKCRSAGSDTSDAADQLAALPSLLSACGPQMRKVGLYCVPGPLRQQIEATMAAYPDLPGCHVRFKAVLGQPTTSNPLVT